jgi:hypothetical protein
LPGNESGWVSGVSELGAWVLASPREREREAHRRIAEAIKR